MGQFLQGGKKVQIMSQFFLNFTVTIQFDFFKIPQLFWRPFVNLHIFPAIAFLWNYKHPGAPVVIIFYLFLTILVLSSLSLINHHWENISITHMTGFLQTGVMPSLLSSSISNLAQISNIISIIIYNHFF